MCAGKDPRTWRRYGGIWAAAVPLLVVRKSHRLHRLPADFDGVFRQVVHLRLEWTLREGKPVFPETAALWNQLL